MTIKEVAAESGFSINTVSRALNDKAEIHPATKKKILTVAARLGYHPNRLAKGLRSNKTQTIGVIVADIANPYFGAVVRGIEREAQEQHQSVVLQNTDEDYAREERAVQLLLEEHVNGIILTPTQKRRGTVDTLRRLGIPFVLMARHFDHSDSNHVVADDIQGGALATEHLIRLGHERIAMINGPLRISSAKERIQGYRNTLANHGLELDDSLITTGAVTMEDGYKAARSILKERPHPSAIFAFSDFVAFGVMRAIRQKGLRIPEDVAVVGYDNTQFAPCAEVPLTTVNVPKEKLGVMATRVLNKLATSDCPAMQVKIPVRLVVRQSTSGSEEGITTGSTAQG